MLGAQKNPDDDDGTFVRTSKTTDDDNDSNMSKGSSPG